MRGEPTETTGPVAVEWRVLFEEAPGRGEDGEANDDRQAVSTLPARMTRSRYAQIFVLLCLLLLAFGYAFWENAGNPFVRSLPGPVVPAAPSADALAATGRDTILTEHLRIYAWGPDIAVVEANADAMERLYGESFAALGLALRPQVGAPDGRLSLFVQESGLVQWDEAASTVILPSPLAQAGSGIGSQAALLGQSWAIAVADRAVLDAAEAYGLPPAWPSVLNGLRLWLLWDAGGPLAEDRVTIVEWFHQPAGNPDRRNATAEICRRYALWRISPAAHSIPLACDRLKDPLAPLLPLPFALAGLNPPVPPPDSLDDQCTPAQTIEGKAYAIAIALLLEYGVERYGPPTLPRLLAALPQHHTWQTLIPAVYGVSAAEFEAGWRVWLGEKYSGIR